MPLRGRMRGWRRNWASRFWLNTRVREICLHGRQVSALMLEDGEILPASTVISNLDVTAAHGLIRAERARTRQAALTRREVS